MKLVKQVKACTQRSFIATSDTTARDVGNAAVNPELQLKLGSANVSSTMNSVTVCNNYPVDTTVSAPHICAYGSYVYAPLIAKDIRLIRLHPSSNETSTIEVDLIHISLDIARGLGYIALSYTWGSMDASASILVDGKLFEVRPNVQRTLEKLRLIRHQYIWVGT